MADYFIRLLNHHYTAFYVYCKHQAKSLLHINLAMAPNGGNSKKTAGNARKAQAAVEKQAVKDQQKAALDDAKWQDGAKSSAKA